MRNPVLSLESLGASESNGYRTVGLENTLESLESLHQNSNPDPKSVNAARTGAYGSVAVGTNEQPTVADLEGKYYAPSATPADIGRMTMDDVVTHTGIIVGILVLAAALEMTIFSGNVVLFIGGIVVGTILGIVNSFKQKPSPGLIIAYAISEGFALGGVSFIFEARWQGIVLQAIISTIAVFAATILLFAMAGVRATPKWGKIFLVAMVAVLIYGVVNLGLRITGVTTEIFGLDTQVKILGIPLGLLVGIGCIGIAVVSFIMSFTDIESAIKAGAPQRYSWKAAFGLCVTIVWLYTEILRVLAIVNSMRE